MEFVGLDKMSLLDYEDYVSAVIFAPKCNFRCPFCHNGDSVLNSTTEIPFEEIISYLKSRKGLLDAVVVTGGEPTLMNDLENKIRQIKELGYKVKLDTNGTNPELLEHLIKEKLIDYVAMDIKNSPAKYALTAGCQKVNLDKIKQSIAILKSSGIRYEFRTTLVKEFHDFSDIPEIGKLVEGAKKIYLQKFVDREGVIQKGLHPIDEDIVTLYKKDLERFVSEVYLRGY